MLRLIYVSHVYCHVFHALQQFLAQVVIQASHYICIKLSDAALATILLLIAIHAQELHQISHAQRVILDFIL